MLAYFKNLFKRGVLIPVLFGLVCVLVAALALPSLATPTNTDGKSEYTVLKYDAFSNLDKGAFAGTVTCERIGLETAVLYNDNEANAVCLKRGSTEPWQNGCVILIGENTEKKFKKLHAAKVGDKVVFEPAGRSAYHYTIKEIAANQASEKLKIFSKDNTLVMCLPYRDFSGEEDATYYRVFVAEREG